jgi:hypothetical protein
MTLLPTPTISPDGGSVAGSVTVTLADSSNAATIFYSTNASNANPIWYQYRAPFQVTSSETVTAFAGAVGIANSPQISAVFVVAGPGSTQIGAGLHLFSLPETISNISLDSLFGYTGVRLAVWEPLGNIYSVTPASPANQITAGQGYWARFPQAVTIPASGTPAPTNIPFVIQLQPGWNMIGDPFAASIPLPTVMFAGGSLTFAQATGTQLIGPNVLDYDNSTKSYVNASSLDVDRGYWIYAFSATNMSIPPP